MLTFLISKYKSISKAIKCFILSFKNDAALLYKSHIIVSTVTPVADLNATNTAHQPHVDRSGWNIQSRERALLPGAMSSRSSHWASLAPNFYLTPWPCSIPWAPGAWTNSFYKATDPLSLTGSVSSAAGWWHWCPPRDASLAGFSSLVQTQGLDADPVVAAYGGYQVSFLSEGPPSRSADEVAHGKALPGPADLRAEQINVLPHT